jgi:hypothetical protein
MFYGFSKVFFCKKNIKLKYRPSAVFTTARCLKYNKLYRSSLIQNIIISNLLACKVHSFEVCGILLLETPKLKNSKRKLNLTGNRTCSAWGGNVRSIEWQQKHTGTSKSHETIPLYNVVFMKGDLQNLNKIFDVKIPAHTFHRNVSFMGQFFISQPHLGPWFMV